LLLNFPDVQKLRWQTTIKAAYHLSREGIVAGQSRPRGAADTLLLSPLLIITEEQIEAIFAAIHSALQEID
jgi:adenosylmethionine-8-amino-7-oxononanoate aminotransferase